MPSVPEVLEVPLEDRARLREIAESGDTPADIAKRARILLLKSQGLSMRGVAAELGIHYNVVNYWVKRYKGRSANYDLYALLSVAEGRGRKREINDAAVTWLKEQNEIRKATGERKMEFVERVHRDAVKAGFPRLATVTLQGIMRRIDLD